MSRPSEDRPGLAGKVRSLEYLSRVPGNSVPGDIMRGMAVQALYALQNGFMGFDRSGLFYGEFGGERVQIPIACWLVRTSEAMIFFDTGLSPRAVPGLLRSGPPARFTPEEVVPT